MGKVLPKKEKLKVIEKNGLFCYECKLELQIIYKKKTFQIKNGHFHHLIPQIYKGENNSFNACLLCKSCHMLIHSGKETKEKYIKMFENYYQNIKLL